MKFGKTTLLTALGMVLVNYLGFRHGAYYGRAAVQRLAFLNEGLLSEAVRRYLRHARWMTPMLHDIEAAEAAAERPLPSDAARALYSTDDLHGYGRNDFDKGGDTIESQQRGLILPLLMNVISTTTDDIIEIGTGNGDVSAYIANALPDRKVTGIDFSVSHAERKWRLPNLGFEAGYAAEILERWNGEIGVLFASSTFVYFTPAEIRRYLTIIAQKCSAVVLSEPQWFGYSYERMNNLSVPLEGALWFHDYKRYLTEAGFTIESFQERPYRHPISKREDIVVTLISAARY